MKSKVYGVVLFFIASSLFLLNGCSEQQKGTTKSAAKPNIKVERVTRQAWLKELLPADAMLYARVPNPWFAFSSQENGFQYALGNEQHVQEVRKIQAALVDNVIAKLDSSAQGPLRLLLKNMTGPIEFGMLPAGNDQPFPSLIVSTVLDYTSVTDFKTAFEAIINSDPMLMLSDPINDQGVGGFMVNGVGATTFVQFDSASGRFVLIGSMGGMMSQMQRQYSALQVSSSHPMDNIESQIDASGDGLFLWLNPKSILPAVEPFAPQLKEYEAMGLKEVNSIAFGYGVSNQKTRLKVLFEMPEVGLRQYLPAISNRFSVTTVGEPSLVAVLSSPTKEQFETIESAYKSQQGELSEDYLSAKEAMKKQWGFSIEELLSSVGPEWIFFSDDVSDFIAIRLKDRNKLHSILEQLSKKDVLKFAKHQHQGTAFYELVTSDLIGISNEQEQQHLPPVAKELLNNMKSHYYWIEEDGFMIMTSVPQPLIERLQRKDRVALQSWMSEKQRHDMSSSFIGITGTSEDMSRKSYYVYLQLLQLVADLSGSQYDAFALPLASELGFNEEGSLGFSVDFTHNQIALELSFEQSLFDVFHSGNGMTSVAVIGILAAVAIPAYQDYTIRTEVSSALASLSTAKVVIAEAQISGLTLASMNSNNGQFMDVILDQSQYLSDVTIQNGVIAGRFGEQSNYVLHNEVIYLTPSIDNSGIISWSCSSTASDKYLPIICRN